MGNKSKYCSFDSLLSFRANLDFWKTVKAKGAKENQINVALVIKGGMYHTISLFSKKLIFKKWLLYDVMDLIHQYFHIRVTSCPTLFIAEVGEKKTNMSTPS